MRLDKMLAHAGFGSRSQIKDAVKKGQVRINGVVIKDSGAEIKPGDEITFCGKPVSDSSESKTYLMMNKPKGLVCATRDAEEETVLSLLPDELKVKVFPVGRLDKDTEGLLLLTDDGVFCHRLISPKNHIGKTYIVQCEKVVTEEDLKKFREGISIGEEKPTLPAKAFLSVQDNKLLTLTIYEGRFHQVKRMLQATCNKVKELKRTAIGDVSLDENLKPGEWRALSKDELQKLL